MDLRADMRHIAYGTHTLWHGFVSMSAHAHMAVCTYIRIYVYVLYIACNDSDQSTSALYMCTLLFVLCAWVSVLARRHVLSSCLR